MAIVTMGLSAQSLITINDHNLLLGVSIGLLNGQGEEIVYRGENSDDKLSELLWDMKPLVYAGVDINYNWRKPKNSWTFFSDVLMKFGFSGETGVMEDRDWASLYYPNFLTHYSVHDNKTENAFLVDINIGASFNIFEQFILKTYMTYSFMKFSWTASGGSFLYPASDGDHGYLVQPIDVGTYRQIWHIFSPAIALYGEFNRYFNMEISFKVSPLIWFSDKDNHIGRNLIVTKDIKGGFFIEPGLVFSFVPKDFFTISFVFSYRNIHGTRGNGKYDYQGQPSIITKNINGAGYSAFDIGIVTKLWVF
jgi:outer membrane protease